MTKVNIIIGRFQPITKGHYKCIEYAMTKKGVPTVICMINTPDEKVDAKHPFPSSLLLNLYKDIFERDKNVADIILVKNANIVEIGEQLFNDGYEIVSWTCGTDRYASYKKMSDKYAEEAHLSPDFELLEIKRSDDDISATKLRKYLADDNEKGFNKLFVDIPLKVKLKYDPFNLLRSQLLKVIK